MMVYTTGQGVHGFTLDPSLGEFLLSHPDIKQPTKPRYYSVNHSYEEFWTPGFQRYMRWLRDTEMKGGPELTLRYIGSLVSDFHRNLLRGGVYLYPGTLHDPIRPEGKLRLLYEAGPLAFICKQAGGYASDGYGDILEISPHKLHQRVPLIIGDKTLVEKAEAFIREFDRAWLDVYLPRRENSQKESG
jgi:fructose-1,6-bisphosphatase I